MPKDYYGNDKDLYVGALKASLPMFTKDGKMPADGPETVLKVLSASQAVGQGQAHRSRQDLHATTSCRAVRRPK